MSGEVFSRRSAPLPELKNEQIFPGGIRVKALFDKSCKWRLVEEFGPDCFKEQEDGSLLFHADYTNREELVTWLLTFREKAELLEPVELREELCMSLRKMLEVYGNGDGFGSEMQGFD